MKTNLKTLPEGQLWILQAIGDQRRSSGGSNWSSTSPTARARLVTLGFIKHYVRAYDPKSGIYGKMIDVGNAQPHRQHSQYQVTEEGQNYLSAEAFDRGMDYGFEQWAKDVAEEDAEERARIERGRHDDAVDAGTEYDLTAKMNREITETIWAKIAR